MPKKSRAEAAKAAHASSSIKEKLRNELIMSKLIMPLPVSVRFQITKL